MAENNPVRRFGCRRHRLTLASLLFAAVSVLANEAPDLHLQDFVVGVDRQLNFVVAPRDPDGVVPAISMTDAPASAVLTDNGDGTRTFSWQPDATGNYDINFTVQDAQDAALTSEHKAVIAVVEPENVSAVLSQMDDSSESTLDNGTNRQGTIGQSPGEIRKLLTDAPVSVSHTSAQQTPIDTADGYVYLASIEPGPRGDVNGFDLKTVLWQGRQLANRAWEWQSVVIDDRTMHNRWHSAPSVGVDKEGYIHVAYNMHNFPWQYKRSKNPHDIYSLEFLGQEISDDEIRRAEEQNQVTFPTLGIADIPGNQITYPAFYKDRNQDLYVSYRFAAAPKRSFSDRMMSSGVAVYNVASKSWSPVGGAVAHQDGDYEPHSEAAGPAIAMAGKRGWTSYRPKLGFDTNNNLYMSMMWREGTAGKLVGRPCVMRTSDRTRAEDSGGNPIGLPATPDNCGNIGVGNDVDFYSIGSFAVSQNNVPHVLHSPKNQSRFIARYSQSDNRWIQEKSPEGATEIFFDKQNNLYAVASGIKIFKRANNEADWVLIYDEGDKRNCYPSVKLDANGNTALIHTQSCDETRVTIYGLGLP